MTIESWFPRWRSWLVALLALASSLVGIVNWFTYDDRYVIELNPMTRHLNDWYRVFATSYWPKEWGGDGYRPLTILAFKIESVIGGGIPSIFHATNILLYVVASLLVFWVARRMLPTWAAWFAAAAFAVHPVHVEAVANVVGQSELLVAIATLAALLLYLRDRLAGPLRPATAAWITLLYAIACFSKEHGVVLIAVLGAAELTVLADDTPLIERVRSLRLFYLVLALVAVSFVAVRSLVLSDHSLGGFQPFTPFSTLHISSRDRVLTAVGVVPQWIRLLYWPARLSSEYGPPQIEIAQGLSLTQLPGFTLLIGILALGILLRRRRPVTAFGIAFTVIAILPSSNFLVPAGIVLAERTLFLASAGAMLILGDVVLLVAEWLQRSGADAARSRRYVLAARAACAALLVTGAVRSSLRTRVWKDGDTLFHQAVLDAPDAYRAHFMLGAWAFYEKRLREGEVEYLKALKLFPYDPFLAYSLAEQYKTVGLCHAAVPMYQWAFNLDSTFNVGHTSLAWCLLNERRYDEARTAAIDAFRYGAEIPRLRRIMFLADSAKAADMAKEKTKVVSQAGGASKLPESVQKTGRPSPTHE